MEKLRCQWPCSSSSPSSRGLLVFIQAVSSFLTHMQPWLQTFSVLTCWTGSTSEGKVSAGLFPSLQHLEKRQQSASFPAAQQQGSLSS